MVDKDGTIKSGEEAVRVWTDHFRDVLQAVQPKYIPNDSMLESGSVSTTKSQLESASGTWLTLEEEFFNGRIAMGFE